MEGSGWEGAGEGSKVDGGRGAVLGEEENGQHVHGRMSFLLPFALRGLHCEDGGMGDDWKGGVLGEH